MPLLTRPMVMPLKQSQIMQRKNLMHQRRINQLQMQSPRLRQRLKRGIRIVLPLLNAMA
jgi:hypothetical protein